MSCGTRWRAPTAFCSAFPPSFILCRCSAVYMCNPCEETWGTWEQSKWTSSPGVDCLLSHSEPQIIKPPEPSCRTQVPAWATHTSVFGGVMAVTSETEYWTQNTLLNVRVRQLQHVFFYLFVAQENPTSGCYLKWQNTDLHARSIKSNTISNLIHVLISRYFSVKILRKRRCVGS